MNHAKRKICAAACSITAAALVATACSNAPPAPRVIDIQTSDGVILKATVFGTSKPGPGVLLLHQCDEQRKVWDSLGVKLTRAGITAMSVDYRGYGESGGMAHDKLTPVELQNQQRDQWPVDIDSAYKVLLRQPGVEPDQIGVAGGSCGVQNALQLASRWYTVRALALLAGGTDQRGRAVMSADSAPPLFLAAARDDKYANFVEMQGWFAALSPNKQTRVIDYPTGGHAAMVMQAHPELADTIAKWFAAVLLKKPEMLPATNGKMMDAAIVHTLRELDEAGGAKRVGDKLALARKQNPEAQLFPEAYANQLGYEHLAGKDYSNAIEIMKLNTIAYPNSPNAFDSLGDIYLATGDKQSALETARRTLALLEKDTVDTPERKKAIRDAADTKIKELSGK